MKREWIKNILKDFYGKIYYLKKAQKNIDHIIQSNTKKVIFIFPSPSTPWGYMFQRPQQIALSLAKNGNLVFYNVQDNYKFFPDNLVIGLKKLSENLYLHNDLKKGESLSKLNKIIIWRYWAVQDQFLGNNLDNTIQIYDWIDDVNVHKYDKKYIKIHERLIEESDLVIVTAEKLYEQARKVRDDILFLPNACDYKYFSDYKKVLWPNLSKLRKNSKVIVGYFGAIANWFDVELIKKCAEVYKDWIFLLVGQVYPGIEIKKQLNEHPNVKIWERVSYKKLPFLLSCFDIAMIPFIINEITEKTSPVKVYEYMAGGKPVVSTAMHEVIKLDTILIGNSHQEFIEQLHNAYILSNDKDYKNKIQSEAQKNSWDVRVNKILVELKIRGLI
jgi:glycosyltransferase involved in cell wall biosynthesis